MGDLGIGFYGDEKHLVLQPGSLTVPSSRPLETRALFFSHKPNS